jgi:macrolide-specific efflux system membrane fusion protein
MAAPMLTETEQVASVADQPPAGPRLWRRRRVIAVAIVVAVVAAGGAGLGTWLATRTSTAKPVLQVSTETVAVTTGTMQETDSASGTIEPAAQANLSFAVSGQVTKVKVVAGQKVRVGQTLARVNAAALRATVNAAKATLSSAQARLTTDTSDAATASQLDSDQASVTSAKTQLATAKADLADAGLTSTIKGTVASVDLSVGQQVTGSGGNASAGTGGGGNGTGGNSGGGASASSAASASAADASSSSSSAQIVVISTDTYVVSTTVDDTQIGAVKVGDQADITPSGSSTVVYGVVSSVGLLASSSSDVATFPVTIAVTGTPKGVYAGSSASVSIIVKQLNDVVEVPTAAISYSTTGKATVTVVTNGKHATQSIQTGEVSGLDTQVTSGLRAGQQVVERVVKFNGTAGGGTRSLLGGTGGAGRTGFGGGGFGGGGFGGRTGSGGGGAGG